LIFGTSADAIALCLATARGEHPGILENERFVAEGIIPDGPFVTLSMTDRRGPGKDVAASFTTAAMVAGMISASVPEPKLRPVIGKVASMVGKLGPLVAKIDFYKSVASETTFDGQQWRSRSVTHYLSPQERAAQ
jgi:hypothetical protein